jgi:hypothetical protein
MDHITRPYPLRARACSIAALALVAACGDSHDSRADSIAVAHLLAREAVPTLAPGRNTVLTVSAEAAGRAVDSVFRADLAPVATRVRGSGPPALDLRVTMTTLKLNGDSAAAVIQRHGVDRKDTTRFASSQALYQLAWSRVGGWMIASVQPFSFKGEGKPAARPRDAWWDSTTGKAKAPATP